MKSKDDDKAEAKAKESEKPAAEPEFDRRTHVDRINDWQGSPSYAGPVASGWHPDDRPPAPTSKRLPYRLTTKAYHDNVMRRAGEIVEVHPEQAGAHHEQLPDVKYPKG
jgi:hypothetical protein